MTLADDRRSLEVSANGRQQEQAKTQKIERDNSPGMSR
jgi:hypothetical protein